MRKRVGEREGREDGEDLKEWTMSSGYVESMVSKDGNKMMREKLMN